ncbi:hypothetical protein EMIHUDRAFT_103289 [Emiliania huxleyi CCMP1516]|uniref:Uncharacterized protein n=2 Tax=Emiliania huxleyi TaxID=2903 RepID=A0A0D3IVM5_EMIH1|nr:hypothetical protein EMIHUDRAFT_103289 [Emiliania huxleyi CCMP1516]EOD15310.1 hypothetical protein EMIHUDRAFT_103289 [Emiliania huxleyi CCMP1516]|eukprot:XP_005767739.1 hypothetical protein EMIHUDRAFT_103289 [Emiliania huxleyi CCMP1516]
MLDTTLLASTASTESPKRKRHQFKEMCWGDAISGGELGCEALPPNTKNAFREHFCRRCRERGVSVPVSRVRIPVGVDSAVIVNRKTGGVWNEPTRTSHMPAFRVVNQTADCTGAKLVVLRDESPVPLPGLAELSNFGDRVDFQISRTLIPVVPLPFAHSAVPLPLASHSSATDTASLLDRPASPYTGRSSSTGSPCAASLLDECGLDAAGLEHSPSTSGPSYSSGDKLPTFLPDEPGLDAGLDELLSSIASEDAVSPSADSPSAPPSPPPLPSKPAPAALSARRRRCGGLRLLPTVLLPSAAILSSVAASGPSPLAELQLGFAVTVVLILSSLVLPPRTLGKLLTVVTTLAAAFNVAMNLLRHGDELNAAILACHEGRMPFLLLAVAAGALLGAGPSMPAPLHSACWFRERKLCLLGRRSPLRVSDKGLAIAICTAAFLVDYLACSARSTSPHSEVHGRFVALFAASAVAGARGSRWIADSPTGISPSA